MQTPRLARLPVAIALLTCLACGGGDDDPPDGGSLDGGDTCATDEQCSDGVFCNGAELCRPEAMAADARGCVSTGSPCAALQICDEATASCETDCAIDPDADGDGRDALACGGDDCDDSDPRRFPGNVEICDPGGLDEDCDPTTLASGPTNDADGDGFVADTCCNTQPDGSLSCGLDCDDGALGGETNPAATEVCNGKDEDCDGILDEGVLGGSFFPDCDGDGFGRSDGAMGGDGTCAPPGAVPAICPEGSAALWVSNERDCDDDDADVKPGATELCNGRDDDCDGALADMEDNDGDGDAPLSCGGGDCDDSDAGVTACDLAGARTFTWVVRSAFPSMPTGSPPNQVIAGFDLDGRVSTRTDAAGCNAQDLVSPWGEAGVDAQLSSEETGMASEAVLDVFSHGINAGVGVVFQLSEVDGCDDDEATLSIFEARIDGHVTMGERVALIGDAAASFPVRVEGGILVAVDAPYRFPGLGFGTEAVALGRARGACVNEDEVRQLVLGGFRLVESVRAVTTDMPGEIIGDGAVPGFGCEDHISEAWQLELVRAVPERACVFPDCDNDGVGVFEGARESCTPPATAPAACPAGGWAERVGDCDDADPTRFPGNVEACNGVDDNCDGEIEPAWGDRDMDGDGENSVACGGTDCMLDDPTATVCEPNMACEVEMDWSMCVPACYGADCDGDGYAGTGELLDCGAAAPTGPPTTCPAGVWLMSNFGDCDDSNAAVFPGAGCPFI